MGTKRFTSILAIGALLLICQGCVGPRIFSANFNADDIGSPPNPDLPGAPSGDRIKGSCGMLVLGHVFDSNAMYFYKDPDCDENLMWFESKNVPASNQNLFYSFIGSLGGTSHPNFNINFAGGHFDSAFTVFFENGSLYLTDGRYNKEFIGNYLADRKQVFLVFIDRATNTYDLSILQAGAAPNIQLQDRPMDNIERFWGNTKYLLWLNFDPDDDDTSLDGYVIDNVIISKEKEEEMD